MTAIIVKHSKITGMLNSHYMIFTSTSHFQQLSTSYNIYTPCSFNQSVSRI